MDDTGPHFETLELHFLGPYSFMGPENSVFRSPCTSGVYLWTVKQRHDGSHLVHYVGETVALAKRHREHLVNILGLNYGIFESEAAQNGISKLTYPGLWRDKTQEGPLRQIQAYRAIHDKVLDYLAVINIFFAEITAEKQLRKHIEGCIGWNLRNNHPEAKVLYPDDNHIGSMKGRNRGVLVIRAAETIRGLDTEIPY